MRKIIITPSVFLSLFLLYCGQLNSQKISTDYRLTANEIFFLDTLQYRSFLYFLNETNFDLGLVKDRTAEWSPASIAAMGFALPIWAIGIEKEWITREEAVSRTLNMLRFLWQSKQSLDTSSTGHKGLYYHFLKMQAGNREWKCELSSIDTGLLFAGIIFARQYFNLDNQQENEIRNLASGILERADWNFMRLGNDGINPNTIALSWYPERGLSKYGWRGYNEALVMYVIAAGSGLTNPRESYDGWLKSYVWKKTYDNLEHFVFPPMFGHQFSHMFIDFRGIYDDSTASRGIDYFENSRRAVYSQREFAIENVNGWKGYDSLIWGISASDGPGEKYNYNGFKFLSYAGRGASCADSFYFDDGTLSPMAVAGSIPFAPEITVPALTNIFKKYATKGLWGKYGFKDAFNPTLDWYAEDYLGIDQGPIVIMIENFYNGFVWKYFMNDPIVKDGLQKLGFRKL